jgi:hypothetical protein
MVAIEDARMARKGNGEAIRTIVVRMVAPGSRPLRMASKLDPYRPSARIMLEPWLVEKALSRLGGRRLSMRDQETVVRATRTPRKTRWPDWWEVNP